MYRNRVKKSKTLSAYAGRGRISLPLSPGKPSSDLTRKDILKFMRWMRGKDADDRTIYNRLAHRKSFFTEFTLRWPTLKTNRVKHTELLVRA